MIGVYQFTDALTASLFGMFALWAAGSRRHWFVRTAVVGAALLILLLIPAYEALIKFGVQVLVVVGGLSAWRAWRVRRSSASSAGITASTNARLRISLESLLLLMAVVAVVTAVAARAPHFPIYEWYECVFVGAAAGLVVLASVWIVFGRTRWWLRLLALPTFVYGVALAMRWLWVSRWLLQHWITTPSFVRQYWQANLKEGIFSGAGFWLGSITLGMAILCIWLVLMRLADWFDPFHSAAQATNQWRAPAGWRTPARVTAASLFALVALFPLWLLNKLMTPTPIPDLTSPRPNGYDDLVAAGRMIGKVADWRLASMSDAELQDVISKNAAALKMAHVALQRDCRFPLVAPESILSPVVAKDRVAQYSLLYGLLAQQKLPSNVDSIEDQLAANLDVLRIAFAESRRSGVDEFENSAIFAIYENGTVSILANRRAKLHAQQCTWLAGELWKLESQRENWETRLAHERIIAENSGWERHLNAILDDLAGIDRFEGAHYNHLHGRTRMRLLIAALAIRAFELQEGRLPTTLTELTPKYLPVIPDDPFVAGEPLKYRALDNKYDLYSVGPNKADDSEDEPVGLTTQPNDDVTTAKEFPAPPSANAVGSGATKSDTTDEVGK